MREDWCEASLVNDLNYIKTGVAEYIEKKKYYSTGSIKENKIISEGSFSYVDKPSRANRITHINDVLQARMKATDKALHINDFFKDQLFSTGFIQIRTSENTLCPQYIFYYFKSNIFLNEKDNNCSGSTQSALNDKSATKLKVPLAPLPEQRAIVSKIEQIFSELDNGIKNLKTSQKQLKVYRQAVLKKAFEGELTKDWREKQTNLPTADELLEKIKIERKDNYQKQLDDWTIAVKEWEDDDKEGKKPTKPQNNTAKIILLDSEEQNLLINTPKEWSDTRMGNITSHITDGDHQAPPKSDIGIPFITISNIKNNKINFSNTYHVDENYYNSITEYRKPKRGDVLYTVTGSFGIPVLINFDKRFCFQRHIGLIRPLNNVDTKWLYWLLQTELIFKQARNKATGTAQKTVGLVSIRSFVTPFCSIQEQTQIVQEIETRLSVCDNVEEIIKENLSKSEALRQSILKKAFEGKLLSDSELESCRMEEDWEPASELLKKIQLEKSKY